MDGLLLVALFGSAVSAGWLLFEVWLRRGEVRQVPFSEREERFGESKSWRVRAQVPTSHSVEDKWVWVSRKQYAGLDDQQVLPVHVRYLGARTFVRRVNHWERVWWLGVVTLYFGINSVAKFFDQ